MRTRGLAILAVAALALAACGSAATPSGSAAPPVSAAPAASTPATSAAPSTAAGGGVTDTLQMHWLGDCTCDLAPRRVRDVQPGDQLRADVQQADRPGLGRGRPRGRRRRTSPSLGGLPDGLTWTFHLRQGVKWHDGTPFTAEDVKFTINRSLITPIRFTQNAWAAVVGREEVIDADGDAAGINVIDDHTIALTLEAPNADYISNLTDPRRSSCPSTSSRPTDPEGRRDDPVLDDQPIGTGPYKFIRYETDQYTEFEANPDYFQGAPKIQNIFIKRLLGDQAIAQLESGELDLSVRLNPAEQAASSRCRPSTSSRPGRRDVRPVHQHDTAHRRQLPQGDRVRRSTPRASSTPSSAAPARSTRASRRACPPRTTRSSSTTTRPRPRNCSTRSTWDKSKPLRIVFDKSFAGVEQWVPILQQNLEAIGFTIELIGLETTAAIEILQQDRPVGDHHRPGR